MASPEWVEIYQSYTPDDLATEIAELKQAIKVARGITAQTSGSKTYSKDLGELRGQLAAAIRVQTGRSAGPPHGIMDFSNV